MEVVRSGKKKNIGDACRLEFIYKAVAVVKVLYTFNVYLHDIFLTSACLCSSIVLWSFVLGEKEVPVKEPKRSRSDLSASILEQLTTPLHDFVAPRPQMPEGSELPGNKVVESNNLNTGVDQAQDVKVCLFC